MGIEEVRKQVDSVLADQAIRGREDADKLKAVRQEIAADGRLDAAELAQLERLVDSPGVQRGHLRAGHDPVSGEVRSLFERARALRSDAALASRADRLLSYLDRAFAYRDKTLSEERAVAGTWPQDLKGAEARLQEQRDQGKLGRVIYTGVPDDEKLAAAYFLHRVLEDGDSFNAEADLVIPTRLWHAEPRACYTIRTDEYGNATVSRVGDYRPLPEPQEWQNLSARQAAESLERSFGVTIEPGEHRDWRKGELAILKAALEKLDEPERDRLKGTVFIRRMYSGRTMGEHDVDERGRTVISIFQTAFDNDRLQFSGEAGEPTSMRTMLHEIGHALASNPTIRQLRQQHEALSEERILTRNAHYVPAFNARIKLKERGAGEAEIKAADARVEAAVAKVNEVTERANATLRRIQELQAQANDTFTQDFADHPRVTDYARSRGSWEEFFAEAYSLYKVEPRLLQAEYPELYEFFRAGKHLK